MESKIISQQKNPFLNREEFVIEIKADSNPSFEDVKKILAKDRELTVVKKIKSNFGRKTFTAEIFVYDSPDTMKKIEPKEKKKGEETQTTPAQTPEQPKAEEKSEEQTSSQKGGDDAKSESKQKDVGSSTSKSPEEKE